nr:MAG TPA: hypothetical protein [Caudoviricetes sp.]
MSQIELYHMRPDRGRQGRKISVFLRTLYGLY